MKFRYFALVALSFIMAFAPRQKKQTIVFFGDSITQLGADNGGYIRLLDTMLKAQGKTSYDLIGAGVSGNKVYDLYLRMDSDVLAKNPDAVVIWVGVNDVWHKRLLGTGTDPDKFEKFYDAILRKLKARNIRVFICTPASTGEKKDMTNELDGDLNKYSAIIRSIAVKADIPVIDFRSSVLEYLQKNNPSNKDRGILTTDGVHLNAAGNHFVASQMLSVLSREFIK